MGVHCIVLVVMLRAPNPVLVKVQQLRQGNGGRSYARLYWSNDAPGLTSNSEASKSKQQRETTIRSKKLEAPSNSPQIRLERHERVLAATRNDRTLDTGKSSNPATAGSTYGTLSEGAVTGSEVRPALWISGPNPALAAEDFAQGLEGSVIVEITIDDQGNVVATSLLQSLSPAVDARVIEALQMAHFIPAKRNDISIPSKQDVYYHFPR
jgi:TonB family protein